MNANRWTFLGITAAEGLLPFPSPNKDILLIGARQLAKMEREREREIEKERERARARKRDM